MHLATLDEILAFHSTFGNTFLENIKNHRYHLPSILEAAKADLQIKGCRFAL